MEHLRRLVSHFKDKDPETKWPRPTDELYAHVENVLLPHVLRVVQKDNTLLSEVELFPGMKVPWEGTEEEWSLLQTTLIYAVLHGDPKEKFGRILESVKSMFPGSHADELDEILNDEETKDSLKEILDLVVNTRLASLVGDIVQDISLEDLGVNLENPEHLMEILRNPQESPVIKQIMERAQAVLEDRIRSGKINQQEIAREVENIRAKFQSSFGRYLNEMIIGDQGNTTGNTAAQILSNHPDARRARMLARLQKKQKARK
jgi:uncharacterized protein YeeX (DUF496 family)